MRPVSTFRSEASAKRTYSTKSHSEESKTKLESSRPPAFAVVQVKRRQGERAGGNDDGGGGGMMQSAEERD